MRNILFLVLVLFSSVSFGEGTFIKQGALVEGVTRTATTGGTLALTVTSQTIQELTGTLTEIVTLPDATHMPVGRRFLLINASSGAVTVKNFTGTTVTNITPIASLSVYLVDASTSAGNWQVTGSVNSFTETDPLSIHLNGDNSPSANINWGTKNLTNVGNLSSATVTLAGEPASRALFLDGSNVVRGSPTTSAELANISGLTSPVQTQLNSKANTTLSNLATTAINQPLLFGAGIDIGSTTSGKPNLWVNNKLSIGAVTNYGGTFHAAQKPNFTMLDTNAANSITDINAATIVHITSANPNAIAQVSKGDLVALSSAPTVFATVTSVTDNSHFVVNPALGNGQIAQQIVVYPAILNLEDESGNSSLYLNGHDAVHNLGLTGSFIQNGSTSGAITFSVPATITSYPLVWPSAQGGASTVLTNDGSGILSWQSGGGGGGANTFLSNLDSPTAVNQDLLIPANKLQIGPIPGDSNLQASISTDTGYDGPTVLLIQGLGANSNNYNGIYVGNDAGEVGLNIFLNGSGRSSDGGANNATIRMENGGALRVKAVGGLTLEGAVSFPDQINDSSNSVSIDPNGRQLFDDGGNISVDWQNRQLSDDSGNIIVDWNARTISGGSGTVVWNIDLGRFLDSGGTRTLDINQHLLYDNGGSVVANYTNGYLIDPSSNNSLLWIDRAFQDSNNHQVASWNTGFRLDEMALNRNVFSSTSNFTIPDNITWALLNYTTGSQTITLPANPDPGQVIVITTDGAVGSLTLAPNSGQSILGTLPTSITPDSPLQYVWDSGIAAWFATTSAGGGGGGVTGPGSSTANGIVTWSGTGGSALLSTTATMDSSGNQVGTTVSTSGSITAGTGGQSVTIGSNGGGFSGIGIGTPSYIQFDGNGTGIKITRAFNFQSNYGYWASDGSGFLGINGNGVHDYARPITMASYTNIDLGGTSSSGVLTPVLREETPQASVVTTTNGTQTTFTTVALANNTVYSYRAECAARRTDAADRGLFIRTVGVYREAAGSATLQGPVQNDFSQSSDNTWDVTWTVSSNNLLLRVTGASGKTVDWQCNLRSTRVQ